MTEQDKEHRDLNRRQLDRSLPVYWADNGELFGLAVDHSDKGLRLRTERGLIENSKWSLAIQFKEPVMDRQRIEFVGEVRWCHQHGNGFDVGIQVVEISARDSAALTFFAHQHMKSAD